MGFTLNDNSSSKDYEGTEASGHLIPASMLAAYAYCPRLSYLQWVQGEFQDSAETVEGRHLHRWIDAEEDPIPDDFQPFHARSVSLSPPRRQEYAAGSTFWREMAAKSRR